MAQIQRFPFIGHLRGEASAYVLLYRRGVLRRSERAAAFWFYPQSDSIAEIPVEDRELALVIHGRSADFQDVTIAGVVMYRLENPERFIGHASHQSARYRLVLDGIDERQSSSGVIVATGTGSTGWARSIARERNISYEMPAPTARELAFFVREAFPGSGYDVALTAGLLGVDAELVIRSEINDGGAIFGDGIEDDRIAFTYGMEASLRLAPERLRLVTE